MPFLYLVIVLDGQVGEEQLIRDEQPDLRFITFHPATEGSLLVLHERGLLLVDAEGAVRWHRLHDDRSAHLVELSDDEVVLERSGLWSSPVAGIAIGLGMGRSLQKPEDLAHGLLKS